MDTIFAVATGQGRAGVAVIRVSGPQSHNAFGAFGICPTQPRMASLRKLKDTDGSTLDESLVILFEKNQSFTGDPVVEFQVHGSQAVVSRCLEILGDQDSFRSAEPGEFTRRAFGNGRFDLVQVEGLIDVIDAETEMQLRQAQRLLSGERSGQISEWRDKLIEARSLLEVTIDFADEDVPIDVTGDVVHLLNSVMAQLKEQISGVRGSSIIRNGFEVAIVGPPNVGKSTLLNKVTGREIALVSNIPGTTRDIIEARVDLGGLVVVFFDTAGQRESLDAVEKMGVERAQTRAAAADLRVFLTDGSDELDILQNDDDLICRAKDDDGFHLNGVSGKTGYGIDRMLTEVQSRASDAISSAGWVANQRQLQLMKTAVTFGDLANSHLARGPIEYDFVSDNIREMSVALASIIGGVDIEAVYDQIFSRFCLGK